jgi:hypothetical protein
MWRFSDPFGRVITDGLNSIPTDPANTDYVRILAAGVEIAPYAKYASLSDSRAGRLAELSDRRWKATQRMAFDGVQTAADSAIAALTGAVVALQLLDPGGTVQWKLAAGEFRTYALADLVQLAGATRDHIQACFDNELALTAQIQGAETIAAIEAIDIEQGWP